MNFICDKIENVINYTFNDKSLLVKAFTHASFSNEKKGEKNNERMEFLGDSVLGFIVSEYLFLHAKLSEGKMTAEKQAIVSAKPLCSACKRLGLDGYLLVGEGVTVTDNLRENLMESVIGAMYLDGGIEPVREFVYMALISEYLKNKTSKYLEQFVDYKSQLNEYASKHRLAIKYVLIEKEGQDNAPTYTVAVTVNGEEISKATASGKKQLAEQQAAKLALERLQ